MGFDITASFWFLTGVYADDGYALGFQARPGVSGNVRLNLFNIPLIRGCR
jgi:hypothetical protein